MMLSFLIALKFHRGSRRNILISLISLISIISIVIGVAISIIALSIMNGFKYELSKRILSIVPHGEVQLFNTSLVDWNTLLMHIKKMPHIVTANFYINFPGVIEYNHQWNLVYIRSIDVISDVYVDELSEFIESGVWRDFCEHKNQIILGKGVSDTLGIKVGDWITVLTSCDFYSRKNILSTRRICLQVSGILNSNSQLDCVIALIPLSNAYNYYDAISTVKGIAIKVDNIFRADRIMQSIKQEWGNCIDVYSWMDTYGYIYKDIQMVKVIIYLFMVLIIGIACFNVVATLVVSIKNKHYDIAILRALGGSNILIQRIFFIYGLIIYCIAGIIGVALGIIVSWNLKNGILKHYSLLKSNVLVEDVYFINFIPVKINAWDILLILGVMLLIGVFTSWCVTLNTKKINFNQVLK